MLFVFTNMHFMTFCFTTLVRNMKTELLQFYLRVNVGIGVVVVVSKVQTHLVSNLQLSLVDVVVYSGVLTGE